MAAKSNSIDVSPRSTQQLEAQVRRALCTENGVDIGELVVRRLPNGICLGCDSSFQRQLRRLHAVREIDGVGEIVNHLVVCWNCPQHGSGNHADLFA